MNMFDKAMLAQIMLYMIDPIAWKVNALGVFFWFAMSAIDDTFFKKDKP